MEFEYIDLGGGMGIPYQNEKKVFNYNNYQKSIIKHLGKYNSKIIFERHCTMLRYIVIRRGRMRYC